MESIMVKRSEFYNPATAEYLDPVKKRRVAIVTGGNSGIGWFTVLHLYLHGYIVYVAGRTESKVLAAIEEIEAEAKKRLAQYTDEESKERHFGSLSYLHMDCKDLASVVQCAEDFGAKESKLHILINNAGVMGVPFELTKDGYEIQYQVNFVAPFLFTFKLLPHLKNAVIDQAPRVVLLSSIGHNACPRYFEPSDHINRTPNFLFTWIRYGNAKCADIQFMKKFSEVHPDILSFSVHPGVIVETELYNHWKNMAVIGPFAKLSLRGTHKAMGVTSEEGCLATLRAAMDNSLGKELSGRYLETGGVMGRPSKIALSKENAEKTWSWNLEELEKRGFCTVEDSV